MKVLDLDSSLSARKHLTQELHYTGDTNDSAAMNIWLQSTKSDGTYIVEFKTAEGEALAISIPVGETAVLKHFQVRMPYGLIVPGDPQDVGGLKRLLGIGRARLINERDPNGRALSGMQRSTSRVLSRLPRLFSARVGSTNVLTDLPAVWGDAVETEGAPRPHRRTNQPWGATTSQIDRVVRTTTSQRSPSACDAVLHSEMSWLWAVSGVDGEKNRSPR